jgi:hypothetical protein
MATRNRVFNERTGNFDDRFQPAPQPAEPRPVFGPRQPPENLPPSLSTKTFETGIQKTRETAATDPSLSLYNERLNALYSQLGAPSIAAGRGGGGGGVKAQEYSPEFLKFREGMYGNLQDFMQSESPFGASAVARRTESIDLAAQQQKDLLHQDLLNKGYSPGSPQYEDAMTDLRGKAMFQRSQVMQQMAEADAAYGMQKSEVLRGYHDSLHTAEMQNKQYLLTVGKTNAALSRASASALAADEKWRYMMKLQVAGQQFGAGRGVDKDTWNRFMQSAAFDDAIVARREGIAQQDRYMWMNAKLAEQAAGNERTSGIFNALGTGLGVALGLII